MHVERSITALGSSSCLYFLFIYWSAALQRWTAFICLHGSCATCVKFYTFHLHAKDWWTYVVQAVPAFIHTTCIHSILSVSWKRLLYVSSALLSRETEPGISDCFRMCVACNNLVNHPCFCWFKTEGWQPGFWYPPFFVAAWEDSICKSVGGCSWRQEYVSADCDTFVRI